MRVLVTGGNGFVGSWLVKRLVKEGVDVRLLHRSRSNMDEVADVPYESALGDVTDRASVENASAGVDTVFHLAGVVGYTPSMRELMEQVNVQGTINVTDACLKVGVRRMVHVSSVAAIGASLRPQMLHENSPYTIGGLNLGYFETKRKAEEYVRAAARKSGLNAVVVNPSTVYGPGDSKKGSRKIQLKVAQGRFPIYPSGGQSIVSIHDVIDGIWRAWQTGRSGERYILSGENLYVAEVFRKIAVRAGVRPPFIPLPKFAALALGRIGDRLESVGKKSPLNTETAWVASLYHWFDSSKAKIELGFQPGSADAALNESIDWSKEHGLL